MDFENVLAFEREAVQFPFREVLSDGVGFDRRVRIERVVERRERADAHPYHEERRTMGRGYLLFEFDVRPWNCFECVGGHQFR